MVKKSCNLSKLLVKLHTNVHAKYILMNCKDNPYLYPHAYTPPHIIIIRVIPSRYR